MQFLAQRTPLISTLSFILPTTDEIIAIHPLTLATLVVRAIRKQFFSVSTSSEDHIMMDNDDNMMISNDDILFIVPPLTGGKMNMQVKCYDSIANELTLSATVNKILNTYTKNFL